MLDPQPEPGTATYNVQYKLESLTDYHYYTSKAAPLLREEHEKRFGKHALVFRTVLRRMEPVSSPPTP